jgi:hypothetical protein
LSCLKIGANVQYTLSDVFWKKDTVLGSTLDCAKRWLGKKPKTKNTFIEFLINLFFIITT